MLIGLSTICLSFFSSADARTAAWQQATQEQEADPYAFDRSLYRNDQSAGFSVVIKLIKRAEDKNASTATIARLRYEAARLPKVYRS